MSEAQTGLLLPAKIQEKIAAGMDTPLDGAIAEAIKDVALIEIKDDPSQVIAAGRLDRINLLIKHIETKRTETKQPYLVTGKDIDSYAKTLAAPLEKAKEALNVKMIAYKNAKAAELQIVAAKEKENQRKIDEAKENEMKLMDRIQKQIHARLFGGQFITGSGVVTPCEPAMSVTEVSEINSRLVSTFPEDQFTYLKKDALKMKKELISVCMNHVKMVSEWVTAKTPEIEIQQSLSELRHKFGVMANVTTAKISASIEKTSESFMKKADRVVLGATKGIRKTINYTVVDLNLVPREFLQLDSTKVTAYIQQNKEAIKDAIGKGSQESAVPGIRFWEDSTNVG